MQLHILLAQATGTDISLLLGAVLILITRLSYILEAVLIILAMLAFRRGDLFRGHEFIYAAAALACAGIFAKLLIHAFNLLAATPVAPDVLRS